LMIVAAATASASRVDVDPGVMLASVNRLLDGFLAMLPLLATALVVFVVLLFLARGLRFVAEKALARSSNRGAATAIGRLLYVAMVALAVLIAVTIAFPSMTPGRLISVLGVGGVAIGFAFKDIFQNLLAGITRQREGWPAGKNPPKPRRLAPPEVREDAGKQVE